jgi:uncharacterized protein YoaH (UPF0181 family)
MTIAEHKLYLFRQIDQMSEDSLIELEKIIAKLRFKQISQSTTKTEEFSAQQVEEIKTLWNEGIASGCAGQLNMQVIREEALRRHSGVNKNGDVV